MEQHRQSRFLDLGHARQLPALEPRMVGQIGRSVVEKLDHLAKIDRGTVDILVLAEPVLGDVQVGEIDAVKGLDVGAVVERGGDEVIDIDRFDIEHPAHMGAAGSQGLHHLVLVRHGIELGLRLSRHLAQRKRGRKNLDEDGFHLDYSRYCTVPVVDGYHLPLSIVGRERRRLGGEQPSDWAIPTTLDRRCCTMPLYIRRSSLTKAPNERVRWYRAHKQMQRHKMRAWV
jgi:hypothetical protein